VSKAKKRKPKADDTIGNLGRAPARTSGRLPPFSTLPPPVPPRADPPPPERGWLRHHLREAFLGNLGLKFLSLVLALTVFLLVNTDRDREISARVGVSYTLPADRVLVSERLTEVRVTVRGPWRRLRRFDEREIDRIDLDLRSTHDGEVAITPDMVRVPSGLTVTSITPRTLRIAFEKRVEKQVEITPVLAGRPMHGFEVRSPVKVDPPTVTAGGAEGAIKALTTLRTREIRVDGRKEDFTVETQLVPPDGVDVDLTGPVSVTVELKVQLETRRLGKLAVRVIGGDGVDPIGVVTDPPAVDVVLNGPVAAVEEAVSRGIVPIVKLVGADATRKRTAVVVVEGVPPGVGIELVPAKIEVAPVRVKPGGRPPAPGPQP
jgi:hypothetical protein